MCNYNLRKADKLDLKDSNELDDTMASGPGGSSGQLQFLENTKIKKYPYLHMARKIYIDSFHSCIGNKRNTEPNRLPSCSISCLLIIAYTQKLEILATYVDIMGWKG